MNTTTIGLDIAKRVFQVHGTDTRGKSTMTRRLKRAEVLRFFANLQPCLIGIEACDDEDGGAAGDARITSGTPRACVGTHGAEQSAARATGRVRNRDAERGQQP
jgi:transposase